MPERGFDTGYWTDPTTRKLPVLAKLLKIWSFTNDHTSQSGLYEVSPDTISDETGIPGEQLEPIFRLLEPGVIWYQDRNLVWVRNFIRRQAKSSKFIQAAAKALAMMSHNEDIIKQLLAYNQKNFGLSIPYQYYREKLARLSKISSSLESSELLSEEDTYKPENILDPNLAAMVKYHEEKLGLLTPIAFEKLKDIADNYPEGWFEKATDETCTLGKRSLSYIEGILKNWKAQDFKPLSIKQVRSLDLPEEE